MRRNHLIGVAAIGIVGALAGAFLWLRFLEPLFAQARVATGYMAKTVCSCMFVAEHGFEGCRADALLDRGEALSRVAVAADAKKKRVRASVFPLSSDTASYEAGYGCTLE
jgi:hypothetical protein